MAFVLRVAFAVLLYLFLLRLVSAIRLDLVRARRARADDASPSRDDEVEGRLIVIDGGKANVQTGRSFSLSTETLIGRAAESDVRLSHSLVSAQHARLRRVDGRWLIADLDSTNGTTLNQQPIRGEQTVEYGDVIGIGDVRLKLAR